MLGTVILGVVIGGVILFLLYCMLAAWADGGW